MTNEPQRTSAGRLFTVRLSERVESVNNCLFSVSGHSKLIKIKNQDPSIDKVQILVNEGRYIYKDPRQDSGRRNISYTRYPKKCFTQTLI